VGREKAMNAGFWGNRILLPECGIMALWEVIRVEKKAILNITKAKLIVYRTNKKSRRIDTIMLQSAVTDIESATHLDKDEIEKRLVAGQRFEDAWNTFFIKKV
jgi:hypothetical protein